MSDEQNPPELEAIAVIGMAGRFPSAKNIAEFWEMLCKGREGISHFSREELLESGTSLRSQDDPDFVSASGVIADADKFDADFFGFSPNEARLMDPQQRLFLETAYHALETSGYAPDLYTGLISVYAGAAYNTYFLNNVVTNAEVRETMGAYPIMLLNDKDYLATRVSYKLNLRGASFTVQTACSTSLVAVHQACAALLSYSCDLALAGGVAVHSPRARGYLYEEGMIFSPDGKCRPFDAEAKGTVPGEGVGVVVLKRLSEALADGDTIDAVILGSALNNDGGNKVGFSAPSVNGQAEVIATAQAVAGVAPETISYVEAHGTGTLMGDPIELAALTQAFRMGTDETQFCVLGSVKANIGHPDVAAGVIGLIKTVLCLKHRMLTPTLHYTKPNPHFNFATSPFFVNTDLREWTSPEGKPRRAGVSSFGIGGTNAHVILQQAPLSAPSSPNTRRFLPLVLSAKTPEVLGEMTANLEVWIKEQTDEKTAFSDAAYTLAIGRNRLPYRRALIFDTESKTLISPMPTPAQKRSTTPPKIAFLFPGQGAQFAGMARSLYSSELDFKAHIDECTEFLTPLLGVDLREMMFPERGEGKVEAANESLKETRFAQPALFIVSIGLAKLWMKWGVAPDAMLGHSVGEYAAACLSGAISLEDALRLIAMRGNLMSSIESGGMLAVRVGADAVREFLPDTLEIAADNAPDLCVVSGKQEAIDAFALLCEKREIGCQKLHTSHAFHSKMMEPILSKFKQEAAKITFSAPRLPYLSNVTGDWITERDLQDPGYWGRHLRGTMRFREGVERLLTEQNYLFLEVGSGQTLTQLVKQFAEVRVGRTVLSSLAHAKNADNDAQTLLSTLSRLWEAGVEIDWAGFFEGETRRRIPLPTYPFVKKRHWLDVAQSLVSQYLTHSPNHAEISISCEDQSKENQMMVSEKFHVLNGSSPPHAETEFSVLTASRLSRLLKEVKGVAHLVSGMTPGEMSDESDFLMLGFDSLLLVQLSQAFRKKFGVKLSLNQLMEEVSTPLSVAQFLDRTLAPDLAPVSTAKASVATEPILASVSPSVTVTQPVMPSYALPLQSSVVAPPLFPALPAVPTLPPEAWTAYGAQIQQWQQFQQFQQFLQFQAMLTQPPLPFDGGVQAPLPVAQNPALPKPTPVSSVKTQVAVPEVLPEIPSEVYKGKEAMGPFRPVQKTDSKGMTERQKAYLEIFMRKYIAKTPGSKAQTSEDRPFLADPRVVVGFRQNWKEVVYPIVAERSKGSRIWDVDGNEYIDLVMGFGCYLLGYSAEIIVEATKKQLDLGFEIGPQSKLAGKVAKLISELTGMERVAMMNTGSEAVMTALRLARTVTGRDKIAVFTGAYHGNFDSVVLRQKATNGERPPYPISAGIPESLVEDMILVEYGTVEALEVLRREMPNIAAVLVEPIQSRNLSLQPFEFLHEVKKLCEAHETCFLLDDIVMGFRLAPNGSIAYHGIEPDMATYGKVIGGGMPIGVVTGKRKWMDAIDGGQWNYGDASYPEEEMTFYAGCFCKHPLAMASAYAFLTHIKANGNTLYSDLERRVTRVVEEMNAFFKRENVPVSIEQIGSVFRFLYADDYPYVSLFLYHLMFNGVHIWEGRNAFISTAHTDSDLDFVVNAVKESVHEMQAGGFFPLFEPPMLSASLRETGFFDLSREAPPPEKDRALSLSSALEASTRLTLLPLSEAQNDIWVAAQLDPDAALAYNESYALQLTGNLDPEKFERAVRAVIARHDILRARILPDGERQEILPNLSLDLPVELLKDREELAHVLEQEALTGFDFKVAPLFRARLFRIESTGFVFSFVFHHILLDDASGGLFFTELSDIYSSLVNGTQPQLDTLMPLSEYLDWLKSDEYGLPKAKAELYWTQKHRTEAPYLELPTDFPRPEVKTYACGHAELTLDSALLGKLKKTAAQQKSTLFHLLATGFYTFLHRLTGETDVTCNIVAAGQSLLEDVSLMAHASNLLSVRVSIDPERPFAECLAEVKKGIVEGYEHQHLMFGTLIRALNRPIDRSRLPLSGIVFNIDKLSDNITFAENEIEFLETPRTLSRYDLLVNLLQTGDTLRIDCHYNSDLYRGATVERYLAIFRTLLESITENLDTLAGDLSLLTDAETEDLLFTRNLTETDYPQLSISALFTKVANENPDAIALEFEGGRLSYAELDSQSNQMARFLQTHGVKPEDHVAILMERSPEMIVSLLSILKAGAAYVPLSPGDPMERKATQLRETKCRLVLTQKRLCEKVPDLGIPALSVDTKTDAISKERDTPLEALATPEGLAYVMYTSGSTGTPKGVCVPHRAVVRLVRNQNYIKITGEDAFLQLAPLSFDASTFEIWGALLNGASLTIFPPHSPTLSEFGAFIGSRCVTVLWLTASLFYQMIESELPRLKGVRVLLTGGEAPSLGAFTKANQALPYTTLINGYGPTENTTFSVCYRFPKNNPPTDALPLGVPISNTRAYVLDNRGKLLPIGVPGELFLGGGGLAIGYLDLPALTSEKFVIGRNGERLYRTGDLVKWREDRTLQFLGRLDGQIKLRGFRIELGEIEAALRAYPEVEEATVILQEATVDDKKLVAYYVALKEISDETLKNFLRLTLPDYMIPSHFVRLNFIPLKESGKVDRLALPLPEMSQSTKKSGQTVLPATETETRLITIWTEVLGVPSISVTANFFDLGGHSLLAVKLFSRIEKSFGKNLPLSVLFTHSTVRRLATLISPDLASSALPQVEESAAYSSEIPVSEPMIQSPALSLAENMLPQSEWDCLVAIQRKGDRPPFFSVHAVGANVLNYRLLSKYLGNDQPFYGFQAMGLDGTRTPSTSVPEMAALYIQAMCSVQPEGPYYIGGGSSGGIVAYEMANQLQKQGCKVALLALLDTYCFTEEGTASPANWERRELIDEHLGNLIELSFAEKMGYLWRASLNKLHALSLRLTGRRLLTDHEAELPPALRQVRRAILTAIHSYRPSPYPGKVTMFLATKAQHRTQRDPRLRWAEFAEGGMDLQMIPADHDEIMEEPHVRTLALRIRTSMDDAIKG